MQLVKGQGKLLNGNSLPVVESNASTFFPTPVNVPGFGIFAGRYSFTIQHLLHNRNKNVSSALEATLVLTNIRLR